MKHLTGLFLCLLLAAAGLLHASIPLESITARLGLTVSGSTYAARYKVSGKGLTGFIGPGMGQMILNGTAYPLNEIPVWKEGSLQVSEEVERILGSALASAPASYWQTVTLDPGHGGKDPGAISPFSGMHEKDVVLDIAKTVRDTLVRNGVKVHMTRETDLFIPLEARAASANSQKSHLFVSIHANACEASDMCGVEVFYGDDWPESNIDVTSRAYYLAGKMDLNQFVTGKDTSNYSTRDEVFFFKMMLAESNRAGRRLAQTIADRLSAGLGTENRGIKTKNLRVIRLALCPAVLIEVGFLTNKWEAQRLADPAQRQKTSKLIAAAILEHLQNEVKKE